MNQQPAEPLVANSGDVLDVHSIFATIQGEGPFSGHRAVFVRLAGCNLQCPGCDTLYTAGRHTMQIDVLCVEIGRVGLAAGWDEISKCLIVITGGEPLRQPIGKLVHELLLNGFTVQIETNGTCAPDPLLADILGCDEDLHLICSPKTPKLHPRLVRHITAYKYVLDARHLDPADGLPTRALELDTGVPVARPKRGVPVYVTPYHDPDDMFGIKTRANMGAISQGAMRHGYIAGLQIHKQLGLD